MGAKINIFNKIALIILILFVLFSRSLNAQITLYVANGLHDGRIYGVPGNSVGNGIALGGSRYGVRDEGNNTFLNYGFFGMDLSSIPTGSIVSSAQLCFNIQVTPESDPSKAGPFILDHYDWGDSIELDDFDGGSIQDGFDSFSNPVAGTYCFDVTAQLQYSVDNTNSSGGRWFQIRVRPDKIYEDDSNTGIFIRAKDNVDDPAWITFTLGLCPGVTIDSFAPLTACEGAAVVIDGGGFGDVQGLGTVFFNGTEAVYDTWSDTSISVFVPNLVTTGPITVTSSCGSNFVSLEDFTIIPPPSIDSFSPVQGCPGDALTITGSGFDTSRGSGSVEFNGTPVAVYDDWTESEIMVIVPDGTTTGPIKVINDCGASNVSAIDFTVPAPVITSFDPTNGCVGDTVVITGTGFLDVEATVSFFNGVDVVVFVSWNDLSITVEVPPGAITGPITVVNDCNSSFVSTNDFTVPILNVTDYSQSTGCAGYDVTFNGTGFLDPQGAGNVKFNGIEADAYPVWTDTQIVATVPVGGSGAIEVSNSCGSIVFPGNFTIPVPYIAGFSPVEGCPGEAVTITGTSNVFLDAQGTGFVSFNGTPVAVYNDWAESKIMVIVPDGATTGPITVMNDCGMSNVSGIDFTIPVPVITLFSPTNGCEGDTVIITGIDFLDITNIVLFNGTPVVVYTTWEDLEIIVEVPPGATTGPITVVNDCGQSNTSAGDFLVACDVTLTVSKSIIDVQLNGTPISAPIPGSTITYQINYSNAGLINAVNMIIYDQLPANVEYFDMANTPVWIEQYSYDTPPIQTWGGGYANIPPGTPEDVTWVRWINPSVGPGTAGFFTYRVVIE